MLSEAARLAALRSYGILDTPADPEFDRIALAMAQAFNVPSAIVSFVDEDRQWYKAKVGVAADSIARNMSFCTHALKSGDVTVVPDARCDPRFSANPVVTSATGIRFYAAAPIKTPDRARIGTVCVFDTAPRFHVVERHRQLLAGFAARVVEVLERRRAPAGYDALRGGAAPA